MVTWEATVPCYLLMNLLKVLGFKPELRSQEARKDAVREIHVAAHDDEVLGAKCAQPFGTLEVVEHDLRFLAQRGNSTALTLFEAQSEGNFLSPQSPNTAAKDILGLVVMLGRV